MVVCPLAFANPNNFTHLFCVHCYSSFFICCMPIRLIRQLTSKSNCRITGILLSRHYTSYHSSGYQPRTKGWYCRRHVYFQLLQICVEFFHICIRTFVAEVVIHCYLCVIKCISYCSRLTRYQ
jgi:hypothetical protein